MNCEILSAAGGVGAMGNHGAVLELSDHASAEEIQLVYKKRQDVTEELVGADGSGGK
jgi:hypothetical protein